MFPKSIDKEDLDLDKLITLNERNFKSVEQKVENVDYNFFQNDYVNFD